MCDGNELKAGLEQLYAECEIPMLFLNPDGSIFYVNKAGEAIFPGTDGTVLSLSDKSDIAVLERCAEEALPVQAELKSIFPYKSALLVPIQYGENSCCISVRPSEVEVDSRSFSSLIGYGCESRLLSEGIEQSLQRLSDAVNGIASASGEENAQDIEDIREALSAMLGIKSAYSDFLLRYASDAHLRSGCVSLGALLEELEGLTGCVDIISKASFTQDIYIFCEAETLFTAFTMIAEKYISAIQTPGCFTKLPIKLTTDGNTAVIYFILPFEYRLHERECVYTVSGDVYDISTEPACRVLLSLGGRVCFDTLPDARAFVCRLPVCKRDAEMKLSSAAVLTEYPPADMILRRLYIKKMKYMKKRKTRK